LNPPRAKSKNELPFQAPFEYELVLNLKTAKVLGLSILESFLLLADMVIE
jgi:putative ABC transport system substrate-binding protein